MDEETYLSFFSFFQICETRVEIWGQKETHFSSKVTPTDQKQ